MRVEASFLIAVLFALASGCGGDDSGSGGTGGAGPGGSGAGGSTGGDSSIPEPPPPEDFPTGFGPAEVYVPNLTNVVRLGTHAGYVYFTEMGLDDGSMSGLSRADADGNVQTLFSGKTVTALHLDDDELFFVERGTQSIYRMPYDTLEPALFTTTDMTVGDIDRLGETLWITQYAPPATSLIVADRTSGATSIAEPPISPGFYFTYLAIGHNTVYAATTPTDNGSPAGIYQIKTDRTGGSFAPGVQAVHFAADAQYVYYSDFAGKRVVRQAHGSKTAEVLADGQNYPDAVGVDGGGIYWSNQSSCDDASDTNGSIVARPLSGGDPVAVATDQTCPVMVATDTAFVYWTKHDVNRGAGTDAIMRAAKLR
jgi:sugar lactone lactonase YvrE